MARLDGPALLDRIYAERLDLWAEARRAGPARPRLRDRCPICMAEPAPPPDVADRMAPMQWLLELAAGRYGRTGRASAHRDRQPRPAGRAGGGRAVRLVGVPDRPPRSESDIWRLGELRSVLQRAGALRRSARRLVLGTRGKLLLNDPVAQWSIATTSLVDPGEFDGAAQEATLMLLLQARTAWSRSAT